MCHLYFGVSLWQTRLFITRMAQRPGFFLLPFGEVGRSLTGLSTSNCLRQAGPSRNVSIYQLLKLFFYFFVK
jgi:hypothetical protein